jgi:hypothetical protein
MSAEREKADQAKLDPASLTPADAARLLHVEREWIEADVAAGAPTNADGTINLVHYAAWLNAEMREDGDAQT